MKNELNGSSEIEKKNQMKIFNGKWQKMIYQTLKT